MDINKTLFRLLNVNEIIKPKDWVYTGGDLNTPTNWREVHSDESNKIVAEDGRTYKRPIKPKIRHCFTCGKHCNFKGVTVGDWAKFVKETGWIAILKKGKNFYLCPDCEKEWKEKGIDLFRRKGATLY